MNDVPRTRSWRRSSATPKTVHPRDPAASMALIFDAMRHPLDPAYEEAARRRVLRGTTTGSVAARSTQAVLIGLVTILVGVLIGCAAAALRTPKTVAGDGRSQIIAQIQHKQSANDDATDALHALRGDLAVQQANALGRAAQGDLRAQLSRAQSSAGLTTSTGSGITVTLDNPQTATADSADGNPRTDTTATALTSTDLQRVVNGLWQAGATAVAVNDQRLTSLSAIRFAGSAILVNYRPLTTPYTIRALGPGDVAMRFAATDGGRYLDQLRSEHMRADVGSSGSLTLPPAPAAPVSHATVRP